MTNIWKKAKNIYSAGVVRHEGTNRQNEYYQVEDLETNKTHNVKISNTPNGVLLSCDCTFQSLPRKENLDKGRQAFCSHCIATIFYKHFHTKIN